MKRYLPSILSITALLLATLSSNSPAGAGSFGQVEVEAGAPTIVSYQGQVTVDGTAFNGTGYFKFAVINTLGAITWSSSSLSGTVPNVAVQLPVTNGLFSVLLGDTNPTTAPPGMTQNLTFAAFSDPNTVLRVWFSPDNTTFQQLSPDRRIAAVPYAMWSQVAQQAATVGGLTSGMLALKVHEHSGSDITSGLVSAAYIDNAIARLSDITPTILALGGPGSGFDADLLDGQHGNYYTDQVVPLVTAGGFITKTLADSLYGANTYSNGDGLILLNNVFSVNFAGSGSALAVARSDHKHGGADITSGLVGAAYIDDAIARVANTVALAGVQTITGTKIFSPASGAPFTVTSTTRVANLNADLLDGNDATTFFNASNITAGTLYTGVYSAYTDLVAEDYLGNAANDLALNNGTVQATLNADLLDGKHASAFLSLTGAQTISNSVTFSLTSGAPFTVSASNTTMVENLNADLLDGNDAGDFVTLAGPQTVTGTKTFNPASGVPFSVGAVNTVMVDNLNADLLDGNDAAAFVTLAGPQTVTGTKKFNPASGVPFSVGAVNTVTVDNLNADLLDGKDASAFQLAVGPANDCTVGSAIRQINADGTVVCDYDARHRPPSANASTSISTGADEYVAMAIGGDGLPLLSYFDHANQALQVYHCSNVACTSGTTSDLEPANSNSGKYSSIAIGADGFGVIAYQSGATTLKVVHCGDADCTDANATKTIVDSTANSGYYTSIAIGSDGKPKISYGVGSPLITTIVVFDCNNLSCSSTLPALPGTARMVDNTVAGTNGTSIAIGADGNPIVVYYDSSSHGDLDLLHCTLADCTTFDTHIILDGGGTDTNAGAMPSITIGADGMPLISEWGYRSGQLLSIHCTKVDCSSTDGPKALDDGDTFDYRNRATAITLGADGYGLIAYYDWNNVTGVQLKVAHCANMVCSGATTYKLDTIACSGCGVQTNPDAFPDYARTAIAIGSDGLPILAYLDFTTTGGNKLQVVHCDNAFCVPFARPR